MIYRLKELKGDTIPVPQLIFSKLGIAEEYNVRVALYVLATGVTDPEKICADLKLRSRISAESALSFWAGAGLLERYDENAAPGAEPSAPAPMTWAEIAAASRTDPMISSQNVARQASLKAGLPVETPAVTVNVVCGSGLNCVNMAAQMIEAGDADIVVAGGMENMDMAPFAMMKGRYGYRMGAPMGKSEIVDTMVNDALWDACGFNKHMGMTAENVCTNETYQKKYGYSPITREMLDEFSYNSQLKADKAIKDGAFKDEIVPVVIKGKKGDTVFDTDEGPRLSAPEVLAKLKPAFTKDGIVTAGNSSAINDGAAALVIMSEEKAKELGVKPLATWVAGALAGVEPEVMGLGPIAATKKVMAKTGLTVADMDLIEANEAFAAQSVAVSQALNFDMSKVNVNGGAIALGHPVGASGARILVTLLYAMKHRGAHKGLATLCIGGGMGCATIVAMD